MSTPCTHPQPVILEIPLPATILLDDQAREVRLRFVEYWCTMCEQQMIDPKMYCGTESWDQNDFDHGFCREIF